MVLRTRLVNDPEVSLACANWGNAGTDGTFTGYRRLENGGTFRLSPYFWQHRTRPRKKREERGTRITGASNKLQNLGHPAQSWGQRISVFGSLVSSTAIRHRVRKFPTC